MKEPICIDLRPRAKAHRYRWRWEESRQPGENDAFFVEILCKNGLIYPYGGETLLAYATRGVKRHIAGLGLDVKRHQTDGEAEVFKFPVARLDEVAAILKPKRLPGSSRPSTKQLEVLRRHAFQVGQALPETMQDES